MTDWSPGVLASASVGDDSFDVFLHVGEQDEDGDIPIHIRTVTSGTATDYRFPADDTHLFLHPRAVRTLAAIFSERTR